MLGKMYPYLSNLFFFFGMGKQNFFFILNGIPILILISYIRLLIIKEGEAPVILKFMGK